MLHEGVACSQHEAVRAAASDEAVARSRELFTGLVGADPSDLTRVACEKRGRPPRLRAKF